MPTPAKQHFPARPRNGSILVFVLVFIVLLTFIVTAFLEDATAKIKYYGLFHNRDDLRVDAYSALEIALGIVNQYRDAEGALWGPAQGWGNPLHTFGFSPANASSVTVTFEDESAKLPLQGADYNQLLLLFRTLGFPLNQAEAMADGLLDWMDEDDLRRLNGFDGDDYDRFDPPYRPANRPIQSWDEFRLIEPLRRLFWDETGNAQPAWQAFRSAVSLFHSGPVNINGATPLVLDLLHEQGLIDRNILADYLAGRDRQPGTDDDRIVRAGNPLFNLTGAQAIGTEVTLLRVRVEARRGEARFQLEALVSWAGANPSAGGTRPAQDPALRDTVTTPDGAAERQLRARGSARTAPDTAAQLGYPFRFVRLVENRNF